MLRHTLLLLFLLTASSILGVRYYLLNKQLIRTEERLMYQELKSEFLELRLYFCEAKKKKDMRASYCPAKFF